MRETIIGNKSRKTKQSVILERVSDNYGFCNSNYSITITETDNMSYSITTEDMSTAFKFYDRLSKQIEYYAYHYKGETNHV